MQEQWVFLLFVAIIAAIIFAYLYFSLRANQARRVGLIGPAIVALTLSLPYVALVGCDTQQQHVKIVNASYKPSLTRYALRGVNIREGPGIDWPVVGKLARSAEVRVDSLTDGTSPEQSQWWVIWMQVERNPARGPWKRQGYVISTFLIGERDSTRTPRERRAVQRTAKTKLRAPIARLNVVKRCYVNSGFAVAAGYVQNNTDLWIFAPSSTRWGPTIELIFNGPGGFLGVGSTPIKPIPPRGKGTFEIYGPEGVSSVTACEVSVTDYKFR